MKDRTLEGKAYGVLDDYGTLTLLRSNEDYVEFRSNFLVDVLGAEHDGMVMACPEDGRIPGWATLPYWARAHIKLVHVADGQAIRPTSCNNWFADLREAYDIDLAGLDTSQLESTKSMFRNCYCLESLDLSGWDTPVLQDTDRMFNWCLNLKEAPIVSEDSPIMAEWKNEFAPQLEGDER